MSNGEPWEFFKTIENTVKGLEEMEVIAIVTFYIAFSAFYVDSPHEARKGKDLLMLLLKPLRLSSRLLDKLEDAMLVSCDALEKLERS